MYSTHSEGKFVISERFIRTLKKRIYKSGLQIIFPKKKNKKHSVGHLQKFVGHELL